MDYGTLSGMAGERVCAECGVSFRPQPRGRPSLYCRPACRQRAWALRQAAARLAERGPPPVAETGPAAPATETEPADPAAETAPADPATLPAVPEVPTDARGWARTLSRLTAQLSDPGSALARAPWEHLRLYDALGRALTALDTATPGGLAWLERHD